MRRDVGDRVRMRGRGRNVNDRALGGVPPEHAAGEGGDAAKPEGAKKASAKAEPKPAAEAKADGEDEDEEESAPAATPPVSAEELAKLLADPMRDTRTVYLPVGKYTVEISAGAKTAKTKLEVKAPKNDRDAEDDD